jgi:hypothetical protein
MGVQNSNWYTKGLYALVSGWCKSVEVYGKYAEK